MAPNASTRSHYSLGFVEQPASTVASSQAQLKERFSSLVDKWRKDTASSSILSLRYAHPAYQEIVAMGSAAVPLILSELKNRPDRWFFALKTLTGHDASSQANTFDDAVSAWLNWGREKGYKC